MNGKWFLLVALMGLMAASAASAQSAATPAGAAAPRERIEPAATVVVAPFSTAKGVPPEYGMAVSEDVTSRALATGVLNTVHRKQLDAELARRDLVAEDLATAKDATPLARALGGHVVVIGKLSIERDELVGQIIVAPVDGGAISTDKVRGPVKNPVETLEKISLRALGLVAKLKDNPKLKEFGLARVRESAPGNPPRVAGAASEKALMAYVNCLESIVLQPLSGRVRRPVYYASLEVARGFCETAQRNDPSHAETLAVMAMLDVLLGSTAGSDRYLKAIPEGLNRPVMAELARFYELRNEAKDSEARDLLADVIRRRPGFLLARGYLAEHFIHRKDWPNAQAVLEDYLARSPRHPFVMGQLGYVKSKMGDTKAAVELTSDALKLDSSNPGLLLELGSRHIDAKEYKKAIPILAKLAENKKAPAEVLLRLGYAQLLDGDLKNAEDNLGKCLVRATSESDWRTRGRAYFDLAKISARRGDRESALRNLDNAVQAGFLEADIFRNDSDLKGLSSDDRFEKILSGKSMIGTDSAGDDDVPGQLKVY
ncbi:MAG: hypothetical protein GMKNLPBB_02218 [Myxococcota bacterium]|nr:hypothetical protein [Myxococcota bacterium]